jgi:hypothetical protein
MQPGIFAELNVGNVRWLTRSDQPSPMTTPLTSGLVAENAN